MNPDQFIIESQIIEPDKALSVLINELDSIELLPALRYKFGDAILPSIVSVQQSLHGHWIIVRSDDLPPDFESYVEEWHKEKPLVGVGLRRVMFDFAQLLNEQDRQQYFHHCENSRPWENESYNYHISELTDFLFTQLESAELAKALNIFVPAKMDQICIIADLQRKLSISENNEISIEEDLCLARTTGQKIFSWAKSLAKQEASNLRTEVAQKTLDRLKAQPAYGVHGDEFESAWDEYQYAINAGSLLFDMVEDEIQSQLWRSLSELKLQEKMTLWMDTEEAEGWVEWRLQEGLEFEHPTEDEMRFQGVLDQLRSELNSLVEE